MIAKVVKHMLAAGMSHQAIVAALEDIEAEDEASPGAIRTRRWRERHSPSQTSQVTDTVLLEINSDEINSDSKIDRKKDNTPRNARDVLVDVVDDEHAQAFIEHRKKLRKPLTPHAASLVAKKLSSVSNPNQVIDIMIEKGWAGFEPSWLENISARTLKTNGHSGGGIQFRETKPDPPKPTAEERERRVKAAELARNAIRGMS